MDANKDSVNYLINKNTSNRLLIGSRLSQNIYEKLVFVYCMGTLEYTRSLDSKGSTVLFGVKCFKQMYNYWESLYGQTPILSSSNIWFPSKSEMHFPNFQSYHWSYILVFPCFIYSKAIMDIIKYIFTWNLPYITCARLPARLCLHTRIGPTSSVGPEEAPVSPSFLRNWGECVKPRIMLLCDRLTLWNREEVLCIQHYLPSRMASCQVLLTYKYAKSLWLQ